MIAMKRFLIIFLVSVCSSLGLLAQSSSVRTVGSMRSSVPQVGASAPATGAYQAPLLRTGKAYVPSVPMVQVETGNASYGMSLSTTRTKTSQYRPIQGGGAGVSGASYGGATGGSSSSSSAGTTGMRSIGLSVASVNGGLAVPMAAEDNAGTVVDMPMPNTGWIPGQGRPNGPAGGQLAYTPVGDALLPLLLMAAAYACFLLRRRMVKAAKAAE